jgi:hypothetical protein
MDNNVFVSKMIVTSSKSFEHRLSSILEPSIVPKLWT